MDEKWTIEKNGIKFLASQEQDECGEIDYYGKYTDKFQPWCIDRKTGYMYGDVIEETMPEAKYDEWYNEYSDQEYDHSYNDDDTVTVWYYPAVAESRIQSRWGSRDYRYFIPMNHVPHNPKNWAHVSKKDCRPVIKQYGSLEKADIAYALQDYERMERYGDYWSFVGIVVKMFIEGEEVDSASLWGIESDSDDKYFLEETDNLIDDMLSRVSETIKTHQCIVKALKDLQKEKAA